MSGSTASPDEDSLERQRQLLDELSEKRPLKKLQEELEHADGAAATDEKTQTSTNDVDGASQDQTASSSSSADSASQAGPPRKPLLKNDDDELIRVGKVSPNSIGAFDPCLTDGRS